MNLTKTAIYVKKVFKYLFLFVGSYYIVTLIIFPGSIALIRLIFVRSIPPNPIYGQMEQLEFIQKRISNQQMMEIILDTPNAKLPQFLPDKMTVYKFKPQQYSYLAGNNAIADAEKLGFTQKDLLSDLKGTVYKWRNSATSSNLTIDVNSRKVVLNTNLNGKSSNFEPGSINEESAIEISKNLLLSIFRFNDDLYTTGTQTVKLGYYAGTRVQYTEYPRSAQIALVDFYRSIDKYPILGPDSSKGLLRVVVRNPPRGNKSDPLNNPLVEADYWEIDTVSKATYPIITVNEAWKMVREGNGVITSIVPRDFNPFENYSPVQVDKIFIDNVYLAYYENPNYRTYLQPIYVFSGTYSSRNSQGGDIVIYFPAITGEYVSGNDSEAQ
ncbi:hypothetical protein K0B04_00780 [Patescibacteria group bacterium]|nr:hypothetical protein [Patescibacteria group bacterium]